MKEKDFQKKLDNIADSLWLYEGGTPISNISQKLKLPRSTVSDWIHRCQERKITWKALVQSTLETQATWLFGPLKENSDPFLDKEDAFFREVRLQKLTIKEKIELYKQRFGEESVSSESAFYRKIKKFEKRHPQEHHDFTIHQTYSPGQTVLIDYSGDRLKVYETQNRTRKKQKTDSAGKNCVQYDIFVAVFGYSGWVAACLTRGQTKHDWLTGIDYCFGKAGGVPRELVLDNSTSLVLKADRRCPTFNKTFKAFCQHYGTTPHACSPGKPKEKSLVENMVGFLQRTIAKKQGTYIPTSFEEADKLLQAAVNEINDRKRSIGISRNEAFAKESALLQPLPSIRYSEGEFLAQLTVRKGHQIRYKHLRYNVDWGHIGKKVTLLGRGLADGRTELRICLSSTGQCIGTTILRTPEQGNEPNDITKIPEPLKHIAEGRDDLLDRILQECGPGAKAVAERVACDSTEASLGKLRGIVEHGRYFKECAPMHMEAISQALLKQGEELSYEDFISQWRIYVENEGIGAVTENGLPLPEPNIRGKNHYQKIYDKIANESKQVKDNSK